MYKNGGQQPMSYVCREYINDKYTFLLLKKNRILMRFMQLSIKDKYSI